MITPASQDAVQNTFDKIDYACRYSVWRLFYETDYLKQQQENEGVGFDVTP